MRAVNGSHRRGSSSPLPSTTAPAAAPAPLLDPAAGVSGLLEADHKQHLVDAYKKYSPLIPADRRGTSYAIPLSAATVSRVTAAGQCSYEDYDATRHTNYRSVLGTLSHVANFTHPEMAFAISFASQYMQHPF